MVSAARSAHERLATLHDSVVGELSVSAPIGFAAAHLANALLSVLESHPSLTLRLVATDDQLDLLKERIDISITIGTSPPATSLVRRHLADWQNVLVASPSYLAAHGTPKKVTDLASHSFVTLPPWHHPADVLTGPQGERYRLQVAPRVVSNNQHTIKQLALAGVGLSFHVLPEIADEVAGARLKRVLPDWSLPKLSVDALMPPRATQPAKVRAALDALASYLSKTTTAGPPRRRRRR
jgi:DNA-binding transcriptional LysR family regulator